MMTGKTALMSVKIRNLYLRHGNRNERADVAVLLTWISLLHNYLKVLRCAFVFTQGTA